MDTAEQRVNAVNALSVEHLQAQYVEPALADLQCPEGITLRCNSSTSIEKALFEKCFCLIEETSSETYRASKDGWSPKRKRAEMKDKDMRFLTLHTAQPSARDGLESAAAATDDFVGFAQFMFTPEQDFHVIYCYELHVVPGMQSRGLGAYLMKLLDDIGKRVGVSKAMLTVFTANEAGMRFYKRHGYEWYDEEPVPAPRLLRLGAKAPRKPEYYILAKDLTEG